MKRPAGMAIFFIASVALTSCATGYISKDGGPLKQYLSPEGLKRLTVQPDPNIWIIDLRSESSYESEHIPTAKSFPTEDIMNRLSEISKDKSLILYCIFSPGAQMTIRKLEKAGYTKLMNWGAYSRWPYEPERGNPRAK